MACSTGSSPLPVAVFTLHATKAGLWLQMQICLQQGLPLPLGAALVLQGFVSRLLTFYSR